MVDKDILLSACLKKHMRFKDLAKILEISPCQFSRKINSNHFSTKEIGIISEELNLSIADRNKIFFAK